MQKKSLLGSFLFSLVMVSFMVYGMVNYNIALSTGEFTAQTLLIALSELPIMVPIGLIVEMGVVERLAVKLAFRFVSPETDSQTKVTRTISTMMVMLMCPTMSLIATVLFNDFSLAAWGMAWLRNLPVAFVWQLFICGPVVRYLFSLPERMSGRSVSVNA